MLKNRKILTKILLILLLCGTILPVIIPVRGADTIVHAWTQVRSYRNGSWKSTFQVHTWARCRPVGGGFYKIVEYWTQAQDYQYDWWLYPGQTNWAYEGSFRVIKRAGRFGGWDYVEGEWTMTYYKRNNPSVYMKFKLSARVGATGYGRGEFEFVDPDNEYNLPLGQWKHYHDATLPTEYIEELVAYYWDYTEIIG
jgi:hypothetical protein